MSTHTTIPFTPDNNGEAIAFQQGSDGSLSQVVVAKGGDKLSCPADVSVTGTNQAGANLVVAEDPKRVSVTLYNSGANPAFIIGATSDAGTGLRIPAGSERTIQGGAALYAYRTGGNTTLEVSKLLIGA